jgi:ABC transporter, phosphonate, periplasmic substrate-binding protein
MLADINMREAIVKKNLLCATIALVLILIGSASLADGKNLLLCLPGFPGTQTQAQPYINKMLRYIETQLAWDRGSLVGVFLPDGSRAAEELRKKKPEIALVGPSIYASQHGILGMKIIAKIEVNDRGNEVYSVVTHKDGPKTLDELVGKTIQGSIVHDEKYVYNVLLGGKVAAGKLSFKSQKRPLSALRNVARGKTDAAIVDQSVIKHLDTLPIAADVKVIYTSKPVPAPVIVVMGNGKAHAAKLKKALVGMCKKDEGRDLCKTLTISSIKSTTDRAYKKLLKNYSR